MVLILVNYHLLPKGACNSIYRCIFQVTIRSQVSPDGQHLLVVGLAGLLVVHDGLGVVLPDDAARRLLYGQRCLPGAEPVAQGQLAHLRHVATTRDRKKAIIDIFLNRIFMNQVMVHM